MQFRQWFRALCLVLLSCAASSAPAWAQVYTDALHEGANEYQIWAGSAPAVNPSLASITVDEPLTIAGFRYSRVMVASKSKSLQYTMDVIPAAFTNTLDTKPVCAPVSGNPGAMLCESEAKKKSAYGFGASPIGMQLNFKRTRRLQPMVNGTAGFLFFDRQVPVSGASEFNFAFSVGGGMQWFITPSRSITFGGQFHHFSNAFITNLNPAVDSYFFYAGFSLHR